MWPILFKWLTSQREDKETDPRTQGEKGRREEERVAGSKIGMRKRERNGGDSPKVAAEEKNKEGRGGSGKNGNEREDFTLSPPLPEPRAQSFNYYFFLMGVKSLLFPSFLQGKPLFFR